MTDKNLEIYKKWILDQAKSSTWIPVPDELMRNAAPRTYKQMVEAELTRRRFEVFTNMFENLFTPPFLR